MAVYLQRTRTAHIGIEIWTLMSKRGILDGKEKLGRSRFNKTQNTGLHRLLMNKQEHYIAHWVKPLKPNSEPVKFGTPKNKKIKK